MATPEQPMTDVIQLVESGNQTLEQLLQHIRKLLLLLTKVPREPTLASVCSTCDSTLEKLYTTVEQFNHEIVRDV
jgi:hypothetical protein